MKKKHPNIKIGKPETSIIDFMNKSGFVVIKATIDGQFTALCRDTAVEYWNHSQQDWINRLEMTALLYKMTTFYPDVVKS